MLIYMIRDGAENANGCMCLHCDRGVNRGKGGACRIVYICKGQFLGKLGLDSHLNVA
jgi:hypothetical protein